MPGHIGLSSEVPWFGAVQPQLGVSLVAVDGW